MNCPSQADSIYTEGWNQNLNNLNADATTEANLSHVANARLQRDHRISSVNALVAKNWHMAIREFARRASAVLLKYARFIGPGFMVAVAYIDPGRDVFL